MCAGCCCPRKGDRVTPQGLFYKDFPHFVNGTGNYIFCRYWEPKTPPRALAMILHGAGEHSGRYLGIASMLTKHSLFVFSHDHVGHGQSEGKRMSVSDFRIYIRDCLQHFDMVVSRYPNLKVFILGHALMLCAKVMYHLMPNLTLGYMDPRWLSRSLREVKNFENDPLNYHGPYKMKFTVQVLQAVAKLEKILPSITWPMLILHGDADKLCDIRGSFLLYKKASSIDKTLKIFSKCFHQLHREVPRVQGEVYALIGKWIDERLPPLEQ
ncbi:monoglyceride lipase-like isoform X2 [Scyliorhinus canicula]|uniref:monoglyceride lipase-like isoform X2 n=1 Tax=Scyliorhinus canicula TaxID=7830 RepID=UPI0018F3EE24|nr:monoglyceride lipase-like isoform X2 [Scyliorhinus canicula]